MILLLGLWDLYTKVTTSWAWLWISKLLITALLTRFALINIGQEGKLRLICNEPMMYNTLCLDKY